MSDISTLIKEAGLTEGEAKVYLSLLKLGSTTSGPVIEESKVANSIVYRLLESLIQKGLASYIIKDKTKYFQAAQPQKIIEYIEDKKEKLEQSKKKIEQFIPSMLALATMQDKTSVQVYEGFKGIQTAYEHWYSKVQKGEELVSWGVYPVQEEKYHIYWQKDHVRRKKYGVKFRILVNQGTDKNILKNRNGYWGCDCRYMPTPMKTPAWFMVFKDTALIVLQSGKEIAVEIINQDIADSFKAYFEELWQRTKPFRGK